MKSLDGNVAAMAALSYAALGWRVFPCNGKEPLTTHGVKDASSDETTIRSWWTRWPDANIAIACGASGLVVVDVDDGEVGEAELAKLGELTPTLTAETGSGGKHYYFRRPDGEKWGNTSRRVPHLDTRGDGGYVIAPPSIHPETKRSYDWQNNAKPAALPQVLVDAFYPPKKAPTLPSTSASALVNIYTRAVPPTYATRALEEECKKVANAGEGTRNHTLNGAAFSIGQIVGAGLLPEGDAERELWNAAMAAGLDEGETTKTIASGLRDGKKQPRQVRDRAPRKRIEAVPTPSAPLAAREPDEVVVVGPVDGKISKEVEAKCRKVGRYVVSSVGNIEKILQNASALEGLFRFNEFTNRVELHRSPPWRERDGQQYPRPLVDVDVTRLRVWLEEFADVSFPKEDVGAVVWSLADLNAYNPIRDYLDGLTWDGTPRLDTWMHRLGGAVDDHYTRAISAAWAISAVARVYRPGCKVDHTPVLEGDQGIGKSTLIRTLVGGPWFLDHLPDIGSKDAAMLVGKAWVHEFSELATMQRAEVEPVKQFLAQQEDVFRPPYGRDTVEIPRKCVFIATTNRDDYLKDVTGNRRFWPVRFTRIDLQAAAAEREQLWAEAVVRFRAGEPWHLVHAETRAEAQRQQADRLEQDPWESEIAKHCDVRADVPGWTTTSEVTAHLKLELAKTDRRALGRVKEVLTTLGWIEVRSRSSDGRRLRRWVPRETVDQSGPKGGPEGGPEGSSSRTRGTSKNGESSQGTHNDFVANTTAASSWCGGSDVSDFSGPSGPEEEEALGSGEVWTKGLRSTSGPAGGSLVQRVAE